jgi:nicotinamide riboside transporter PnuC
MKPLPHIILGFIFSLLLLIIFPQIKLYGFLVIFLSSFLIDVDHYIYYVCRKKDFSLKNAYNWFIKNGKKYKKLSKEKRKKVYLGICVFHGIESFIIISILSFYSKFFLFILTGFLFHRLTDSINSLYEDEEGHPLSIIDLYLRSSKLKDIEDI